MELLARTADGYFDLAIVDPPYGIGESGSSNHSRSGKLAKAKKYKDFAGNDKEPMPPLYFQELKRVSQNQIIWGANHFIENIPNANSSCWIVWDKCNSGDFADCELAYTSFDTAVRQFTFRWNGMLQQDMANKEFRIHPTQKPVALYKWLLDKYVKPLRDKHPDKPFRILDTHLGSGSIAIACHDYGFDLTACELDTHYYNAAIKRIEQHQQQLKLFTP
jgi:site-specific DNA-methyltransferase (adenine-specific)